MKNIACLFIVIAIILSDIMCFIVAYNYRDALCSIEHKGFSAPAEIAFLYAIPFILGIFICIVFAIKFNKKK